MNSLIYKPKNHIMYVNLLKWLLIRAFNGKKRKEIEPCIKELYRRMASENLPIESKIIKVKKGTRRYDLVFFETKEGTLRVNLGRHWERNAPVEVELN